MALAFSIATLEAWRQWSNTIKIMMANNFKCKILDPTKLTTKCEGRIKTFFRHITSQKDYISCVISQKKHSIKTQGKTRTKEIEETSQEWGKPNPWDDGDRKYQGQLCISKESNSSILKKYESRDRILKKDCHHQDGFCYGIGLLTCQC